jgi:hypothetical protein
LLDGLLGCFFFDGGDFDFVMGVGGTVVVIDAHEPYPSNLPFSLLCARPALFVSKEPNANASAESFPKD